MFKILILAILLVRVTFSQTTTTDGPDSQLELELEKITSIYQQKCFMNANADGLHKIFSSSFADNSKCIQTNPDVAVTVNDYCSNFGKEFLSCTKKLADIFSVCLDKDEKYLPDLLLNGLNRILHKFCTDDYLDRFNKIANTQCKTSLQFGIKNEFLINCFPKLNIVKNIKKGELSLRKEIVCGDITKTQECLVDFLKRDCQIIKENIELVSSVLHEYRKECFVESSVESIIRFSYLNAILVTIFVVISL